MFSSFVRRLSRIGTVLKFLSPEEIDDRFLDNEKNLYKRDIITAALNLELFEEDLVSSAVLAREIDKIGRLAFAGGPQANRCAGTYIPNFANLLSRSYLKNELRVSIIKSLSVISLNNAENQRLCFEEDLPMIVGDIIHDFTDATRLWAVYCLYCMVLDNIPLLQNLKEHINICAAVQAATKADWTGFSHNYARILLKVAGIVAVKKSRLKNRNSKSSSKISPDSSEDSGSYQEDFKVAKPRTSSKASAELEIVNETRGLSTFKVPELSLAKN